MRTRSRRPGRSLFVLFMAAAFGALFMAVPLVGALEAQRGVLAFSPAGRVASAGLSASAGSSGTAPVQARQPTFERCDRNRDGRLDKSEAAAVPGLSAHFERGDSNRDGRLDKVEFAKALALLDARR